MTTFVNAPDYKQEVIELRPLGERGEPAPQRLTVEKIEKPEDGRLFVLVWVERPRDGKMLLSREQFEDVVSGIRDMMDWGAPA